MCRDGCERVIGDELINNRGVRAVEADYEKAVVVTANETSNATPLLA